ncbi:MAG: primosomal protein N', partial [Pseudomonadales bacterium]|nr:primosomal protein N' [Pseudomonadales bacterium]
GSGKTEVYLQLIEKVLALGCSALVLVPEIGLTPQTVSRFKQRFNIPITLLHSGLSDQQRAHDWLHTAQEAKGIIIGTRSSVFTPIHQLGIIIVDEEHDLSFKQQDGLRYSARDVAVMRAHQENIPVILGSATPSLESLYNVQNNRYHHLHLPERAGNASLPSIELIDIRSRPLQDGFSQPLISAISEQLANGNQVLVFLNRRGFSPILICHECGWMAKCQRCDARLTLHLHPYQLHCHHCSAQKPVPKQCPECSHTELNPIGVGTERSEQALSALFPKTDILRIDRDTTRTKSAMQNLTDQIKVGVPCILVGTQMLAKGHHFPNVTLVAILEADAGFFSADFRSLERMGQLIIQVSGRAGRANKRGKVLIQTHHADHPLLNQLITQGYPAFARHILVERQQTGLPPYSHAVLIKAEAVKEQAPFEFLNLVQEITEQLITTYQLTNIELFGPIPAVMYKRSGRYRAQLILICSERKSLHRLIAPLCLQLENLGGARKVRWSVDVDPLESI